MRQKKGKNIYGILLTIMMILWTVTIIFPFVWMFINSFKSTAEIISSSLSLPATWKIQNYTVLFNKMDFFIYFKNTILVSVISLAILILFSSMAAYALSCYKYRWSKWIFIIFVMGIMIPQHASLIPLFVMMRQTNMLDKVLALTLPYTAFELPLAVYILIGFMRSIPHEILEAATIDGCGIAGSFFKIIFPISRPGITTISIFCGVWFWNEFLYPLLFTSSTEQRTLSIGIKLFVNQRQADYGAMLAGITLSILPSLLFYFSLSDKIIEGMTAGAVKG